MIPMLHPIARETVKPDAEYWRLSTAFEAAITANNLTEAKRIAAQLNQLEAVDVRAD